jgi:hypothetical protein
VVDSTFDKYRADLNQVHKESMDVLNELRFHNKIMATKADVEYVIQKTKIMCDQFNFSVHDLKNQIDTTDTYIENYLPLRNVKEISSMMSGCVESEVYERIQAYESIKIKELYARLITNIHILPDFKTRLL